MARSNRSVGLLLLVVLGVSVGGCKDTVASLSEAVSPTPDAPIVPGQVGGRWGTRWGTAVCNLVLTQNGTNVTGTYTTTSAPPGNVTGTYEANVLSGTWSDQAGGRGRIALRFAPDGHSFTGTWGSGSSDTNGGSWTGTR